MNNLITANLIRTIITLFLFLMIVSCDGFVGIKGRVFEMDIYDGKTKSAIIIDSINKNTIEKIDYYGKPLSGVSIRIYMAGTNNSNKKDSTHCLILNIESDSLGNINGSRVWAPGWYDLFIQAKKEGFFPAEKYFRHNQVYHEAVIIMIPDTNTSKLNERPGT